MERADERKEEGVFWIGTIIKWHLHWGPGRCWKLPLHLLGTSLGPSAASPLGPWLQLLWLRQGFVCLALLGNWPPPSPWFPSGLSLQCLAVEVQVLFPDGPLGKDKMARDQLSLKCGVHLVRGESSPIASSFPGLDGNEGSSPLWGSGG